MIRTPCAATTMKAKGTTAIMAVEKLPSLDVYVLHAGLNRAVFPPFHEIFMVTSVRFRVNSGKTVGLSVRDALDGGWCYRHRCVQNRRFHSTWDLRFLLPVWTPAIQGNSMPSSEMKNNVLT